MSEVDGLGVCRKCGHRVADDAKRCPGCGTANPTIKAHTEKLAARVGIPICIAIMVLGVFLIERLEISGWYFVLVIIVGWIAGTVVGVFAQGIFLRRAALKSGKLGASEICSKCANCDAIIAAPAATPPGSIAICPKCQLKHRIPSKQGWREANDWAEAWDWPRELEASESDDGEDRKLSEDQIALMFKWTAAGEHPDFLLHELHRMTGLSKQALAPSVAGYLKGLSEEDDDDAQESNNQGPMVDPMIQKETARHAETLGLKGKFTRGELRDKYHELVRGLHPDTLHERPEELRKFAETRLKAVIEAKEFFEKHHGMDF